jgi:hypothetical protein
MLMVGLRKSVRLNAVADFSLPDRCENLRCAACSFDELLEPREPEITAFKRILVSSTVTLGF